MLLDVLTQPETGARFVVLMLDRSIDLAGLVGRCGNVAMWVKVGDKSLTAKEGGLSRTMKSSFSDLCIKYDDIRNVDRMAAVQASLVHVPLPLLRFRSLRAGIVSCVDVGGLQYLSIRLRASILCGAFFVTCTSVDQSF